MDEKKKILGLLNSYFCVEEIYLCDCGAVTLERPDGFSISFNPVNALAYFDGNLAVHLQEYVKTVSETDFRNCNHCVNHWGIDLCMCGSGTPVGLCDCDYNGFSLQNLDDMLK